MLTQDVADPATLLGGGDAVARQQLGLALGRDAEDLPALDEPLEEKLDGAVPGVVGRHLLVVQRRGVLAARQRRHRAPQREDVALGVTVVRARRRDPSRSSVALAHPDFNSSEEGRDRKSTRLNSSHGYISYAVFCLKKKKI